MTIDEVQKFIEPLLDGWKPMVRVADDDPSMFVIESRMATTFQVHPNRAAAEMRIRHAVMDLAELMFDTASPLLTLGHIFATNPELETESKLWLECLHNDQKDGEEAA